MPPKAKPAEQPANDADLDSAATRSEGMDQRVEDLQALATNFELDETGLIELLRDAMLEQFKHRPKPWGQLLPGEQRDVAAALEFSAKTFVRKAVSLIAAQDRPHVRANFKKYTDDGSKLSVTLEVPIVEDATVLALHGSRGKQVLIITADADDFVGGREAQTDAEQPDLEFSAGSDRAEHPADDSDLAGVSEDEEEA